MIKKHLLNFLKKDFDLNKTKFLKALNKLDRRGPDKTKLDFSQIKNGNFILGHTRLSIIDSIDMKNLMVFKPNKTNHILTIFTDTSCPYCQKLHNEVPSLLENNIEYFS